MGIIATAAAVALAAGAGYTAYSSSKQKSNDVKAQDAMNQWQVDRLRKIPQLKELKLDSLDKIFDEFLGQGDRLPDLAAFADLLNDDYQQRIESVAPGTLGNIGQLSSLATSMLRGEIPSDVQDLVRKNTAEMAVLGGFGPDSGMGRNLTARDFGLTSLDMLNQGSQFLNQATQMSMAMNPNLPTNWLFSPGTIMQRNDQLAAYNNQIKNANRDRAAMAATPYMPNLSQFDSTNPVMSGISAGLMSFGGSMMGGGMGGGGQQTPQATGPTAPSMYSVYGNPAQSQPTQTWQQNAWGAGTTGYAK